MHMGLDDLIIVNHYNAVTNRLKIGAQRLRVYCPLLFQNDKLGAIGEGDFSFVLPCCVFIRVYRIRVVFRALFGKLYDPVAVEYRRHPLEDHQQALSARIDHACLFENRQQLGGLVQRFLCRRNHYPPDLSGGNLVGEHLPRRNSRQTGNRENRPFGRLHYRLISCLHALFESRHEMLRIRLFLIFQPAGKSTEKQRKDHAGIPARSPQERRCADIRRLGDVRSVREPDQLPFCRRRGHRHIGSGIAVRHRENVQCIYCLPFVRDVVCSRDKRVPEHLSCNHNV